MPALTQSAPNEKRQLSKNGLAVYAQLRRRIQETFIQGRERIEREKVRVYWETGRLIHVHVLAHKDRADYGRRVIERLSEDLEINNTVMSRCLKFYSTGGFPQFLPAGKNWPGRITGGL